MKEINLWKSIVELKSSDSSVSKFVFTSDSVAVESVLYKYPTFEDRTVICCSTQSGCKVGCKFCGAGNFFARNLTTDEIISQPVHLLESTNVDVVKIKKLQIMFMSMGEPFNNYSNLKEAIVKLHILYPNAALLISTSAPQTIHNNFDDFIELSHLIDKIGLQFSVHESSDIARKLLIPTKTCLLTEIGELGSRWAKRTGRRPFFNYCVHLKNNSDDDIARLKSNFTPSIWQATLSVICEKDETMVASHNRQLEMVVDFSARMLLAGYSTRTFNPAGQDDIGGGCGMLWHVQSWARKNGKLKKH